MEANKGVLLDETLVKIAQDAYKMSCEARSNEIKGECYCSKNLERKKKIDIAKKVILGVASVVVISGAIKYASDMDTADEIRGEITRLETSQNLIGGRYETNLVYDEGFVDSMNDLSDNALNNLYDDISKEMIQAGDTEDARILAEVVDQMEENYLEEQGRAR